jgi:hypothetical protein
MLPIYPNTRATPNLVPRPDSSTARQSTGICQEPALIGEEDDAVGSSSMRRSGAKRRSTASRALATGDFGGRAEAPPEEPINSAMSVSWD